MSTIASELHAWRAAQANHAPLAAVAAGIAQLRTELQTLRNEHAQQVAQAYERYEAVQRHMLLEVDRARNQTREARLALEEQRGDQQRREQILRQHITDLRQALALLGQQRATEEAAGPEQVSAAVRSPNAPPVHAASETTGFRAETASSSDRGQDRPEIVTAEFPRGNRVSGA